VNKNKIKLVSLSIALAIFLSGCEPGKTTEESIQYAKVNLVENKYQTAIIELKNAINKAPEAAELRYLLGTTYLTLGNSKAAEKELLRAYELNYNRQNVLAELAGVYFFEHDVDGVNDLIIQPEFLPRVKAKINFYKGVVKLSLASKIEAEKYFDKSVLNEPDGKYGLLASAYILTLHNKTDEAHLAVESIIRENDKFSDAYLLLGQLESHKKDTKAAVNAFKTYQILLPDFGRAEMYLASSYLSNKDYGPAEKIADGILSLFKEQPLANQFKGVALYFSKDYKNALFHLTKALQNGVSSDDIYLLAAVSAFKVESFEQAYKYFKNVTVKLDKSHPAQRLFIATQLKLGYQSDAADSLLSLGELSNDDMDLLATASYELIEGNNKQQAAKLIEHYNQSSDNSPFQLVQTGMLQLSIDNMDGIQKFEQAFAMEPENDKIRLLLIASYIQTKNYKGALTFAKEWKQKGDVFGYNIEGHIYYLQNEIELANYAYEEAYRLFPGNVSAGNYLAYQDRKNGRYKMAVEKFEKVLNKEPDNVFALNQNYLANKALGDVKPAMLLLKKSYSNNKEDDALRINLARVLVMEGEAEEAVSILDDLPATEVMKSSPLYWLILGDSFSKLQKDTKALEVYRNWSEKQPSNRVSWQRRSRLEEKMGRTSEAIQTMKIAMEIFPNDDDFKLLYASLLNKEGELLAALNILKTISKQADILVTSLRGEIYLKQKNISGALPLLTENYNSVPTTHHVALLFTAYVKNKQLPEAKNLLSTHVARWPEDYITRFMFADFMTKSDPELAKNNYEKIILNNPNHAYALNNLAWLEHDLGKYTVANEYAQRALKLASKNENVLDTAGWMAFKNGQKDEAIELLKKARVLSPNNEEINSHLATVEAN
jgi:putative PEP-CTERM system TPR-repeat lipoprotein